MDLNNVYAYPVILVLIHGAYFWIRGLELNEVYILASIVYTFALRMSWASMCTYILQMLRDRDRRTEGDRGDLVSALWARGRV